ncbi:hypothetical protein AAFF_G00195370 [Aldrovandia affinis]|uniref:Poly [ADP-ribose] polymerase n=1 Tax=Aldrovandia affinis TaxID=143900 RepID=A0AAD7SXR6_9TELE|nr:hypothetical protein AAFF_G00195370 [Aldrovandia affinis]
MSESAIIPVDPATAQLLSQCGEALTNVVQSKFGICAILHHMENSGPFQSSRTAQTKGVKRYSVHLSCGLEISVWKDNLTTHHVDAVVNAANEKLIHGAGLAGALSRAGGPLVQQMSDQIINHKGKVPTGEAVITPAGNLPCKAIIHAVGPELWTHPSNKEVEEASHLLKSAVKSILTLAEEEHYQSVAIPALSSGLFNFPLRKCADIIVKTLKDHRFRPNSRLSEIHLVNNDEPTVSEMERACKEILQSKSHSIAVKAPETRTSTPSLQMGSITVHIKKGCIEQEKVDVIVNTISQYCNLSHGSISKAILKKAGDSIQKEIKQSHSISEYGDVIETNGHALHCLRVYHTVCAFHATGTTAGSEILRSVVLKCLDKAKYKYSSISFPAIGTGLLGFSKMEVAHIMMKAFADFAEQNKGSKMDVYVVLYPSDTETFAAFQHKMLHPEDRQSIKSSAFNKHRSGYEGDGATNGAQACIELMGGSLVCRMEAKRWINETILMASNKCTIVNNHVIHFGQVEHEALLSLQTKCQVSIQEFLHRGVAGVTIEGLQRGVMEAVLRVETLCCQAQEEFALTEESAMMHAVVRWSCAEIPELEEPENSVALERAFLAGQNTQNVTVNGMEIQVSISKMEAKGRSGKGCHVDRKCLFKDTIGMQFQNMSFYQRTTMTPDRKHPFDRIHGFDIDKIEKVENRLLEHHFLLKQEQVSSNPKLLYQQVPAQFCDLVCRVGFQRLYSPPKEQKFGAGMYFGGKPCSAKDLASVGKEEYIYIFQAKVLTGKETIGSPNLIIPPATGSGPFSLYDSVKGGVDTHVIFNSHQALPVYLITYKPVKHTHI